MKTALSPSNMIALAADLSHVRLTAWGMRVTATQQQRTMTASRLEFQEMSFPFMMKVQVTLCCGTELFMV